MTNRALPTSKPPGRPTRYGGGIVLLLALLAAHASAGAPSPAVVVTDITHLGGANAVVQPPLREPADLIEMFRAHRGEIDAILTAAHFDGDRDELHRMVLAGEFRLDRFGIGEHMEWIALRRSGNVDVVCNARWAGSEPIEVFAFSLPMDARGVVYDFIVPKLCGNLALVETTETVAWRSVGGADGGAIQKTKARRGLACVAAEVRAQPSLPMTVEAVDGTFWFEDALHSAWAELPPDHALDARIQPGGDLEIDALRGDLVLQIGDSRIKIPARTGLRVHRYEPPTANLAISEATVCVTQSITFDGSGSSFPEPPGKLFLAITRPDGTVEPETAAAGTAGRWERRFDVVGEYQAVVVAESPSSFRSDPFRRSFTVAPCPPACEIRISPTEVDPFHGVAIDASACRPGVGQLSEVRVDVSRGGLPSRTFRLAAPFQHVDIPAESGLLTYSVVALDSLGRESEPVTAEVDVYPRVAFATYWFGGAETRRLDPTSTHTTSSALIGGKGTVRHLVGRSFEYALGLGAAFNDRQGGKTSMFAGVELNWVGDRGFAGVGAGLWDFNNQKTSEPNLQLQFGFDIGSIRRKRVQLFVAGMLFPLADAGVADEYAVQGGFRFRIP